MFWHSFAWPCLRFDFVQLGSQAGLNTKRLHYVETVHECLSYFSEKQLEDVPPVSIKKPVLSNTLLSQIPENKNSENKVFLYECVLMANGKVRKLNIIHNPDLVHETFAKDLFKCLIFSDIEHRTQKAKVLIAIYFDKKEMPNESNVIVLKTSAM
ncbi:hypothetical protein LAG90_01900 [Marinilongibacter aquaticus]|uniref:hypothetical protein n=1 Tax=Marinilongibacter aquaticus TaxID=2975157 RepID=UPI0021BDD3C9|nr:hypothetical protein [Marinilongibacter aquaticus]UBM59410.1 hypothetical protein LAG90_01900 [Marinilongibacter aquaticus]